MISLVSEVKNSKGLKYDILEGVEVKRGSALVKRGFAHMQKHGVIMDVTNIEQAQIAEEAGAVAVMVLDKLPYDVRKAGGSCKNCKS
jgi:pyridoxal 5'-phosphate synthase pdxS subunit